MRHLLKNKLIYLIKKNHKKFYILVFLFGVLAIQNFLLSKPHHRGIVGGYALDISSEETGRITSILANEGELIQKGTTLFELDDSILKAKRKEIEASVALAKEKSNEKKVYVDKAMEEYFSSKKKF